MAPKNKRTKGASTSQNTVPLSGYDPADVRFINGEAYQRYKAVFEHKSLIFDKGFHETDRNGDVAKIINDRGWTVFASHYTAKYVPNWVREFYANGNRRQGDSFYVRGEWVSFSPEACHMVYNITETPAEIDYYLQFSTMQWGEKKRELDRISDVISVGVVWTLNQHGEYLHFDSGCLRPLAKYLLHFINARFLPTTHRHHVTTDRAALIYALMSEEPFDERRLIMEAINRVIHVGFPNHSLAYPFLITMLCDIAMVEKYDGEETPSVGAIKFSVHGKHVPRPASLPPSPAPGSTAALGADTIAGFQYLFDKMDHLGAAVGRLTHMVTDMAAGIPVDPGNYPEPPPAPQRPHFYFPPPVPDAADAADMDEAA